MPPLVLGRRVTTGTDPTVARLSTGKWLVREDARDAWARKAVWKQE